MKIGDLVKYGGNMNIYVVTEVPQVRTFIRIMNIRTGEFSSLPSHWVTKSKRTFSVLDLFSPRVILYKRRTKCNLNDLM